MLNEQKGITQILNLYNALYFMPALYMLTSCSFLPWQYLTAANAFYNSVQHWFRRFTASLISSSDIFAYPRRIVAGSSVVSIRYWDIPYTRTPASFAFRIRNSSDVPSLKLSSRCTPACSPEILQLPSSGFNASINTSCRFLYNARVLFRWRS